MKGRNHGDMPPLDRSNSYIGNWVTVLLPVSWSGSEERFLHSFFFGRGGPDEETIHGTTDVLFQSFWGQKGLESKREF
jgi:hypothetical protein